MKPIVSVENFNLNLGGKNIVSDLSFDVYPGEVFAFLGANGSGKTSTIRALLGIYQATSGKLHINGQPYSPESSAAVGYLPEERGLYVRSKVLDVMSYFGELKGMEASAARSAAMSYLEQVDLADKANEKLKNLSGGQQQKIQLGVAVMNSPKLLILDEPTKGLDPVNRKLLIGMVDDRRQKGTAVIYITHLMEEVERLADRAIIIKDGRREAYGPISKLKKDFQKKSIEDIFVQIYGSTA